MHRKPLLSALPAVLILALVAAMPRLAHAQAESREGIYLQNQILELRQELDAMRARGGAPAPQAPRGGQAPAGGSPELVGGLLDRVSRLEDEVRRLRGQADENENRIRQLQATVEKLQGDMDYRLTQLEGGNRPAAPAPAPAPNGRPQPQGGTLTPPPGASPAPAPVAAPASRPPERALAEGQAALARHDYAAAEAAAREVLANRNHARGLDAQMLLADSLAGRRNWGSAAVAYDDAYKRARSGARAPEALVGLANSFVGLNSKREACETLDELRSNFPNLRGVHAERAAQLRGRAGCR